MSRKKYFQTIHELITTGHWITDSISQELKMFGISEPQYNVLRILSDYNGEPASVHKITDGMVQRSSNVTRIIDKLISKDLVSRKECSFNRRKMDIELTEEGERFISKLDRKVHVFHYPLMENLTEKETKTLRFLIKKLKGKQT